jgi:cellobiose epimerase
LGKKGLRSTAQDFIGMIDRNEVPHPEAAHGVVLISRILWTFSAAYQLYPTAVYQKMADEAYRILTENFWDKENGGVYWSVKPTGEVDDNSKQFYAQSFAIYGLAEYSRTFNHKQSKELAVSLYMLMEQFAFDPENGGYFEAKAANWTDPARDFITPEGDNTKKSMNTHLHVLEAYTNLYRIYPGEELKMKIVHILDMFTGILSIPKTIIFICFSMPIGRCSQPPFRMGTILKDRGYCGKPLR